MAALRDHNLEIAKDVIQRDDDVDRFYRSIDPLTQEDTQAINKIVVEAKKVSQFGVSLESQEIEDQETSNLVWF